MTASKATDTAVLTFIGRGRLQTTLDRLELEDPTGLRVKRNLWEVEDAAAAVRGYLDALSPSDRRSLLRALRDMDEDDLFKVVKFAAGFPRPRKEESGWELPD